MEIKSEELEVSTENGAYVGNAQALPQEAVEALPKAESEAVPVESPAVIEITDAEKLQSTRIELSFMKVAQEIERQNQIAQNIQRGFPQFVTNLAKKYNVDLTAYQYDAVEGNFKRKK